MESLTITSTWIAIVTSFVRFFALGCHRFQEDVSLDKATKN